MANKKNLTSALCLDLKNNGLKIFSSKELIVFSQKSDCFKVAFSLKKKYFNAVERNRIKRIVKNSLLTSLQGNFLFIFRTTYTLKNNENNFKDILFKIHDKFSQVYCSVI